ncbi:MAG: DUF427 domain-containing protein [Alphaproteobacteria bacterium]|jgi:uncharacterized protein (DUF427 family)|nr:DUF427 domain-containing protein [Alphaproteobacteria bacterium]MDP6563542.1 DUF427 domain-containing protein [Alphaproteobacteria bacterium]MDP6816258.1 DUF427 domain-containing protein [Alphaproteobacteria bacterium]
MTQANRRPSGYAKHPNYDVHFEGCPRRVRVVFNGETIADSTGAQYLYETKHLPVYYFPAADVRQDLLRPTDHSSHCPFKGDASYWSIQVGERQAENAVWSYRDPYPETAEIRDFMAFYWNRVDQWFEEDEEVFVHPRDPHSRVDILPSSRPVRVMVDGQAVAESERARFLFETGLPTRYYLPKEDVRADLLVPSDRVSNCPYKGTARYWHLDLDGERHEDLVWSYPEPVAEAARITDYLCFFNERVGAITVDGVEMERPTTQWSK